jgi:hypothetical protein
VRRLAAGLSLLAYLGCALLLPELHRRQHAAHGDDHVHVGDAIVRLDDAGHSDGSDGSDSDGNGSGGNGSGGNGSGAREAHAAFDADLAALELSEVASAGTVDVDCSLADYTLVTCEAARPGHAQTFGDELLARLHRHPARPIDPTHGRGALAHLSGWLLAPAPVLPPPPPAALDQPLPPLAGASLAYRPPAAPTARGPPHAV